MSDTYNLETELPKPKETDALKAGKAALDKADSVELFRLYRAQLVKADDLMRVMAQLAGHYGGSKDSPRYYPESDSAIHAMEHVALAAIELLKTVSAAKT